ALQIEQHDVRRTGGYRVRERFRIRSASDDLDVGHVFHERRETGARQVRGRGDHQARHAAASGARARSPTLTEMPVTTPARTISKRRMSSGDADSSASAISDGVAIRTPSRPITTSPES